MRPILMLAAALVAAAPGLHAQTMFKCVGADGRTSYSDQPCTGKVKATKELDVRANLDDVERDNRRKAAKQEREQQMLNEHNANVAGDPQAPRLDPKVRLMESSDGERRATTYEQIKADTLKRVKEDEETRAKASALWKCKRGPEPEKCS